MVATRKILTVALALFCTAGLVWFVAAFRWECLGGWLAIYIYQIFSARPRSRDRKRFTRILTVEDAEAENMEVCAFGAAPVPFGSVNGQWRELLAMRSDDDVLWEFFSDEEWVGGRVSRAGVALVRDGKVIALVLSAPRRSKVTCSGRGGYRGRRYICAERARDAARWPSATAPASRAASIHITTRPSEKVSRQSAS